MMGADPSPSADVGEETDRPRSPGSDEDFEELLSYLLRERGLDVTGYKRPTLRRRVARRLQDVGLTSYGAYRDLLEAEPREVEALLDTILINVTDFFRDDDVWDILRRRLIPSVLEAVDGDASIRVWSAGCATGQEPYSLALLFAEQLGVDAMRQRVKIYGTDIDEAALEIARRAEYSDRQVESVPYDLRERYFERRTTQGQERYTLSPELRRCVIFGRHNLVSDAPISRVDLLLCRNTLMYFNSVFQQEVVNRLHFSLRPHGYLVLGKVEMLLGYRSLFDTDETAARIFTKRQTRLPAAGSTGAFGRFRPDAEREFAPVAFEVTAVAQVVVSADGTMVTANRTARNLFSLHAEQFGQPFQDAELSYRPIELRSRLEAVLTAGDRVEIKDVELRSDSEVRYLDVELAPLQAIDEPPGVLISFVDVTRHHHLQEQLQEAHHDLETAYEEVQSTNEELETTNEELQSTNEELETTNEELQSTIEELETSNEELRSTNEEFETMNDELQEVNDALEHRNRSLRERTEELEAARAYFASVLDSLASGVAVVDRDLEIRSWNAGAEELWGLRGDEVLGRSLLGLDIGLPVDDLAGPVRRVLTGSLPSSMVELPAHNRRGQPIVCRVHCTPQQGADGAAHGLVLLMETVGDGGRDGEKTHG
jgi:two-component system, chemotaxis family, CheB/CheR fusion protein